eukprot:CAMPEP_0183482340 /NCGR_PEP_ID=MMETSP0370-20130417/176495_1 /TAXON_ID=268820 /ORGANISM="Peridinium aciculiferum, Strain PAER-2" /LENGTH=84 /DNA_ID=CAMNT_0025675521 /DNA_START=89 /DNA_END=340 /DNA_ORIENTATION=-
MVHALLVTLHHHHPEDLPGSTGSPPADLVCQAFGELVVGRHVQRVVHDYVELARIQPREEAVHELRCGEHAQRTHLVDHFVDPV